ncbi:MAG: ABC transporter permease [Gaiellales bacterium]|nr:ABC transporter permease [Gaiellales bacterium]
MIRLGLHIALRSGREGQARFVFTAAGVALATALLLFTLSGFNGLKANDARQGWLTTSGENRIPSVNEATSDPLWWRLSFDAYGDQPIAVVEVAPTGPASPITPGLDRLPAQGEYYASPALAALVQATPPDVLAQRFPGSLAGVIGNAGLTSPDALTVVIGRAAETLRDTAGVTQVRSIEAAPKEHNYGEFLQLALGLGAVGLLLPVLVFVMTSTRLATARREERFAALRLVGATPHEVRILASVEAVLAAGLGTIAGFLLFWAFRPLVARIPFTGHPFFTEDLSLGWMAVVGVLVGVPVVAAVAGMLAMRRVNVSPLGVSRQAPRRRPRMWRLLPLVAGIGLLLTPAHIDDAGVRNFTAVALFALIVVGLVVAGPWLTLLGARVLVRTARRDSTLIAARRLEDDPGRAFRAISGLVLAVFVGTVFSAVVGTAIRQGSGTLGQRDLPPSTLVQTFDLEVGESITESQVDTLLASLQSLKGMEAVAPVWEATGADLPEDPEGVGLMAAADWGALGLAVPPAFGGGMLALDYTALGMGNARRSGPPADGTEPGSLLMLVMRTDGQVESIERARTLLQVQLPNGQRPYTVAELSAADESLVRVLERMVTVGVMLCLVIAGCSLAVSIAGGLVERKRPLSLLRLTGMPLQRLYRAVILEAAVPLTLAAIVSSLAGFLVAGLMLATTSQPFPLAAPGWDYCLMVLGGLAAAMAVVCATLPLLGRVTEPLTVRME